MSLYIDIMEALDNFAENDSVILTHFSATDGLTTLDPEAGIGGKINTKKGLDAQTRSARNLATTDGYMPRLYYGVGVGEPGGYKKEAGLGQHEYKLKLNKSELYDLDADPAKAIPKARDQVDRRDQQAFFVQIEKNIREAGYNYYTRNHPTYGQVAVGFIKARVKQVK